nr:F-box/FBD/LRR-repeat protein At1g13570-like [Aegilops tauschii subsp. strangulata]
MCIFFCFARFFLPFPKAPAAAPPPPPPPTKPPRRSYRPLPAIEAAVAEAEALISLPTAVLDDILNRVGPRDAVRTSALSRAWRRRWEALPSLDLDFDDGDKYVGAVDSILLRCPGRVRLFRAVIAKPYKGRIHDWLLVLSRRGVGILDITGSLTLPSSVFTCGRLTSLRLCCCSIPMLPRGFKGLPELRKLSLASVFLKENCQYQLQEIIATSPLLEVLSLRDVNIPGELKQWVIQGPNLGFLHILSLDDYGCDLGDLPRLDSAVIDIWDYLADRDFSKFLCSLATLTKLQISTYHQPVHPLCLPLLTIEIKFGTHRCKHYSLYDYGIEQKFEANGEFQNAQYTDGMCANLQFVDMTGIHLFSNEMSFIEVILCKARLLRTLSISLCRAAQLAMSNEDGLKKLLNYKKASTHAEVIFEGCTVTDYFHPQSLEMREAVPLE